MLLLLLNVLAVVISSDSISGDENVGNHLASVRIRLLLLLLLLLNINNVI